MCKAPTFKLAVISLEIRFPFSRIFLSPFMFASYSFLPTRLPFTPTNPLHSTHTPTRLIYYSKKKKISLINVQLICMMARNNIFLWLNIPATGRTMEAIPSRWRGWKTSSSFSASNCFSFTEKGKRNFRLKLSYIITSTGTNFDVL